MAMKFSNNAASKLVAALSASATTLKIKGEDVAKFPVLDSSAKDFMHVTIVGDNGEHEIVKVTAVAADGTFTIERAQEGTVAKEWPIENRVELRITAFYLNSAATQDVVDMVESAVTELETKINNLTTTVEVDKVIADNVTITRNAEKKIIAKDIAIGGDSSDLASARGFLYNTYMPFYPGYSSNPIEDFNNLTIPGKYHIIISKDTKNAPPVTLFTSSNTNDGIIDIEAISPASTISNKTRIKHTFTVFGGDTKTWNRNQDTLATKWYDWEQVFRSGDIGDGIKNTNGVLSVSTYVGATETNNATSGLVPAATSAERSMYLAGDGTWKVVDMSKYLPLLIEDSSVAVQYTKKLNFVPKNGGKSGGFLKFSIPAGGGASGGNPCFSIGAYQNGGDSLLELVGTDNGRLVWGDKNIVRSVNGLTADASGNVTLNGVGGDFLPLSGGTLSGNLHFNNVSMYPPILGWNIPITGEAPTAYIEVKANDTQNTEFNFCLTDQLSSNPAMLSIVSSTTISAGGSGGHTGGAPARGKEPDLEHVIPDEDVIVPEKPSDENITTTNKLIFDGKNVVRSVGGALANSDGDISASSLPFLSKDGTIEFDRYEDMSKPLFEVLGNIPGGIPVNAINSSLSYKYDASEVQKINALGYSLFSLFGDSSGNQDYLCTVLQSNVSSKREISNWKAPAFPPGSTSLLIQPYMQETNYPSLILRYSGENTDDGAEEGDVAFVDRTLITSINGKTSNYTGEVTLSLFPQVLTYLTPNNITLPSYGTWVCFSIMVGSRTVYDSMICSGGEVIATGGDQTLFYAVRTA